MRLIASVTTLGLVSISVGVAVDGGGGDDVATAAVGTTESSSTFEDSCWYRQDLVASRLVDPPLDETVLAEFGLEPLDESELQGLLEVNDELDALFDVLAVYQVVDGSDPLQRAVELSQAEGIEASPVLLTTVTGHWTFAPGTDPQDVPLGDFQTPEFSEGFDPDRLVGVVDTGYTEVAATTPTWLAERVSPANVRLDAERLPSSSLVAGHGKFVASIIAQQEPQAEIVVAGMANLPIDIFYDASDGPDHQGIWTEHSLQGPAEAGFTSDEVQLFLGVERLLATRRTYDALNLSVGSYQCSSIESSGLVIRAAIDRWLTEQSEAPIVAAAGNHDPNEGPVSMPFIPAGYSDVTAVASIDDTGALSSFSNDADVRAIGETLIGVRFDDMWTSWGGSSFATAVVSADVARNRVPPVPSTDVDLSNVIQRS